MQRIPKYIVYLLQQKKKKTLTKTQVTCIMGDKAAVREQQIGK